MADFGSYNTPGSTNLILSLLANQKTDPDNKSRNGWMDEFCMHPRSGLILALAGVGFVGLDKNRCDKKSCFFGLIQRSSHGYSKVVKVLSEDWLVLRLN